MIRIASVLLLGCCLSIQAATYYVDRANITGGASDGNTGTATNAPWLRVPGDSLATGVPLTNTLSGGDRIVYMSSYTNVKITLAYSGTPGNPIVYDAWSWGEARKIFTRTNAAVGSTSNPEVAYRLTGRSNIVFFGHDFRNYGGFPPSSSVWSGAANSITTNTTPNFELGVVAGGIFGTSCQDITTVSNDFSRLGHHSNVVQNADHRVINGNGVRFDAGRGLIVEHNTFSRVSQAIRITTGSSSSVEFIVRSNYCANTIRWEIFIEGRNNGDTITGQIYDNYLGNAHEYDNPSWAGGGDNPHTDTIFLVGRDRSNQKWNLNIYDNILTSDEPDGSTFGGTTHLYITDGAWCNFFANKVINNRHHSAIIINGPSPSNTNIEQIVVVGNTFYNARQCLRSYDEMDAADRQITFAGNLVISTNTTTDIVGGPDVPIIRLDSQALTVNSNILATLAFVGQNVYYNPNRTEDLWNIWWVHNFDTTMTLADIRAIGFETNTIVSDPLCVNAGIGVATATGDFNLTASSPAIGAGYSLTNLYTNDFAGNLRTVEYDAGAYEFVDTAGPDTDPPQPNPVVIAASYATNNTIVITVEPATDDNEIRYQFRSPGQMTWPSITDTTFIWTTSDPHFPLVIPSTNLVTVRAKDSLDNVGEWAITNTVVILEVTEPQRTLITQNAVVELLTVPIP